jgi:hypothetical protein
LRNRGGFFYLDRAESPRRKKMSIEFEIEGADPGVKERPGKTDSLELEDTDSSDEQAKPDADDVDPVEALAVELGWNPDFDGDGKVDAKTYILKSREIQDTMREHIKEQKRQQQELSESVAALKAHNEKVYKAEVSRLKTELEELKKERREAIEEGDVTKVEELDERIGGVEKSMTQPETKDKPRSTAEFDAWIVDNKWYEEDPEMAAYADTIASENRGAPFARVAALVDRKVKEMFPDKFVDSTPATPAKKRSPSPVEESRARPGAAKFTKADLTEGQRAIMSQFVRQGIMTEKQYIEDIAKTQGAA